jgi:ribosomal protein L37AE/L43A
MAEPIESIACPYCGRIMSNREADEQGACNDCNGGAYDPTD